MKLHEIITILEKTAPLEQAASWDNSGMQVASRREDVAHMALCLDPTPDTVEKALALGAQCIVSHHPLLMQGRLPSTPDAYHHVLSLLFRADAALYSAHTSLDINSYGPAGWLAEALALCERQVLEPTGQMPDGRPCGFGLGGTLPVALDFPSFLERLREHIPLETATLCGPAPQEVRRVAYCTGSGASLIPAACAYKADVYVTGDVKYHAALDTAVCVLDVGHHSLEEEMMRRFADALAVQLPQIRVSFVPSRSPFRPACARHDENSCQ